MLFRKDIIYLVGPRGSGKTCVGRALAGVLAMEFVDTDEHMLSKSGETVAEVVANHGWAEFRHRESDALRAVSVAGRVVATGGGMVLAEANRSHMRETGVIIYLRAPLAELCRRVGVDDNRSGRPSLTGGNPVDEMAAVLEERAPLYEETAHHIIDCADGIAAVVEQVLSVLDRKPANY
ncbi:MAG: shikimate kinase AroL [Planctomycetaceae bacterium]|nr:shikimate kinase AroL [Planctomycetaceae bacterium]